MHDSWSTLPVRAQHILLCCSLFFCRPKIPDSDVVFNGAGSSKLRTKIKKENINGVVRRTYTHTRTHMHHRRNAVCNPSRTRTNGQTFQPWQHESYPVLLIHIDNNITIIIIIKYLLFMVRPSIVEHLCEDVGGVLHCTMTWNCSFSFLGCFFLLFLVGPHFLW